MWVFRFWTHSKLTGVHPLQHPANRDVQLGSRMSIAPLREGGYFCGKVKPVTPSYCEMDPYTLYEQETPLSFKTIVGFLSA